jgi:hypothetical protein
MLLGLNVFVILFAGVVASRATSFDHGFRDIAQLILVLEFIMFIWINLLRISFSEGVSTWVIIIS